MKRKINLSKTIRRIVRENINKILSESINSSLLNDFFTQHGGLDKHDNDKRNIGIRYDSLGDITDEDIVFTRVYDNEHDAANEVRDMNNRSNQYHRGLYYTCYTANDGSCIVVGLQNQTEDGGRKFGEPRFISDKKINRNREKNYADGAEEYRYHQPARTFGIDSSNDYSKGLDIRKKNGYNHTPEALNYWKKGLQDERNARKKIGLNGKM